MTAIAPGVENLKGGKGRLAKFFGRTNKLFLLAVAGLLAFGLVDLSAITAASDEYSLSRQIMGVGLGVACMLVVWKLDYGKLAQAVGPLLIADVVLLLSPHLPIIGYSAGGATSWVNLGIRFQPGEIAKIVTIFLMAATMARYAGKLDDRREFIKCLAILAVPFLCIMTQPDLGTGLVLLVIGATIMFVGGANRRLVIGAVGIGAAVVVLALVANPILDSLAGTDVFIKDYQINRLLVFVDSSLDPTGVGYNLDQAKIAIGSGGFLGKGLGNATQSALGFLPEAATDFVFCTVAEQFGFVGVLALLALYGLFFYQILNMARETGSLFGKLIIMGAFGMWLFQVLENVGMCLGLMPITGIPLPFISFGSSAMIANLMCVGAICSVWSRERKTSAPAAT